MPHQLVPRGRIFGTAEVTSEPGYETHSVAELSGLGDAVFFE